MPRNAALVPIELCDAKLAYADVLEATECDALFEALIQEIEFDVKHVTLYGRRYAIPRLQAWYGDRGKVFTYSGMRLEPMPWTATLSYLKGYVAQTVGADFNSVLINLYRNGRDSVSWHSDDERELGPEPVIASLSLGATRRFSMRHRNGRAAGRYALDLPSGSLLVMRGCTQHYWQHAVLKTRRQVGARINLTFRVIRDF
jgi:alkylated DNA repair dioxygenase AlkB